MLKKFVPSRLVGNFTTLVEVGSLPELVCPVSSISPASLIGKKAITFLSIFTERKLCHMSPAPLQGRVKTYVVNRSFSELVNELGTDNINAIINNNPSVDDHNNADDLPALHAAVDKKVPYIVSDMSSAVLYYKLSMFNQWGLATSNKSVNKNAYFVPVSRSASGTHRFAGYSINLNIVINKPQLLSSSQGTSLDQYAGALLQCLNLGEPLVNVPCVKDDQTIKVFEYFTYDPVKQFKKCSHTGDTITVSNATVPPTPEPVSEMIDNSLWTLWALQKYIANLNAVSKHKDSAA